MADENIKTTQQQAETVKADGAEQKAAYERQQLEQELDQCTRVGPQRQRKIKRTAGNVCFLRFMKAGKRT